MHTGPPRASLHTAPLRGGGLSIFAVAAKRSAATLGAARWRVWAPILMRAVALGLALLGLAGIGLVASRSPELSALSSPGVALDLAGLGSHAVGTAAGGAALAGPAPSLASPSAASSPPSLPSPSPSPELAAERSPLREPVSASPASTPCQKTTPPAAVAGAPRAAAEGAAAASPGARVALNQASAAELVRLPGVGTKRAAAILALRQRLGRFRRPSDLLRIRGIGPRTLERMLPHLVID